MAPAISGIDAWGNLINRSGVIGKTNTEGLSTSAGTNNQLSGFGYDVAGNMTSNPAVGAAYVYDAENRLISPRSSFSEAQAPQAVLAGALFRIPRGLEMCGAPRSGERGWSPDSSRRVADF
ncbi:MAG: hypothetical protein WAN38_11205 [Terriglobales bacterium]